ncbi:polysaccharide biosynthesis C-terminal domain-containing protein [Iamia sp.]|uniref:MATE family efflux transporter n=1 Tax=Iamia sp. TaxID=2722710 RepID=UPI002BDCDC1C|nr:polysaccharide biosynthesis C-terminal domain-containing protein [Iamia sp.]HXH58070.1 polysaccharide biosynthesis C-terminal domain-containing protein [Iamia sp.]
MTDLVPGPAGPTAVVASEDPGDPGGRALGRSSLINLAGFGVYGLCNFALIVVITRQLGNAGAGALLLAIAVFNIVARSAMAGTDLALVRFTSRFLARDRHREVRHLFRIALVPVAAVSATAAAALFVVAEPLGRLLTSGGEEAGSSADDLTTYLRVLAPFIPVATVYQVIEGGSRGFGTMVPGVVTERLGRAASLPVLMLVVIGAGGGTTAVGLAWAGPYAVALVPIALWTTVLVRRAERSLRDRLDPPGTPAATPLVGTGDLDGLDASPGAGAATGGAVPEPAAPTAGVPEPIAGRELRRRFWAFALPRSFAGVFALTILWVDALMLGALESTESVGVYTAATRWLIVGNVAGNAVAIAFGPQIAAVLATDGTDGARRLFQSATAWLVLLAWPAYLTAMVFAPFLVTAFGDGFDEGATVIVIAGAGFLLAAAAGPIDMLLLMAGRSRLSLINTGIALAANIGANLVLIPHLGIRGAALAWTLSLVVANAVPMAQMWKLLGISPFGARSLRALAIGAGVGVALVASRAALGATLPGLLLGVTLGGAVLVVGVVHSPDRMGMADVLRRAVT